MFVGANRYQVRSVIGTGSTGCVVSALDLNTKQLVAIKKVKRGFRDGLVQREIYALYSIGKVSQHIVDNIEASKHNINSSTSNNNNENNVYKNINESSNGQFIFRSLNTVQDMFSSNDLLEEVGSSKSLESFTQGDADIECPCISSLKIENNTAKETPDSLLTPPSSFPPTCIISSSSSSARSSTTPSSISLSSSTKPLASTSKHHEALGHVIELLDYFQTATHHHLVMPWYQGGDLFTWLTSGPSLPSMDSVLAKFMQVACSLWSIHSRGVVHGDIKTENLLLSADGQFVCLTDFASAQECDLNDFQDTSTLDFFQADSLSSANCYHDGYQFQSQMNRMLETQNDNNNMLTILSPSSPEDIDAIKTVFHTSMVSDSFDTPPASPLSLETAMRRHSVSPVPSLRTMGRKRLSSTNVVLKRFCSCCRHDPNSKSSKKRKETAIAMALPYTPPEIFEKGCEVTCKADIWALGILLVVLVSGKFPWEKAIKEDARYHTYFSTGTMFQEIEEMRPDVRELIKNMLIIDSVKRFTICDVLTSIRRIIQN